MNKIIEQTERIEKVNEINSMEIKSQIHAPEKNMKKLLAISSIAQSGILYIRFHTFSLLLFTKIIYLYILK